jgi:hypothetical protein
MAFTDEVGFIGLKTVDAEAVFVGIDRDGAVTELGGGAKDTDSNFAAIGG